METVVCPNCSASASSDDFTCPSCGVILNETAMQDEPVSLVEALLAPANSSGARSGPAREDVGNDRTVRATVLMDEFTVPRLLVGIDLALKPLTPFEAYVASFIDGAHSVPEIAASAEISNLEAMVVLQTLAFRDVVEIKRDESRRPGEAPELDEEPKTDPEAQAAEDLAPGLAEEDSRTPMSPQLGEAAEPPAAVGFDPEALKAAMLAAAEANYASASSSAPPVPSEDEAQEILEASPEEIEAPPPPVAPGLSAAPTRNVTAAPAAGSGTPLRGTPMAGPGATASLTRTPVPRPRPAPTGARPPPPALSAAAAPKTSSTPAASPPRSKVTPAAPARSLASAPPANTAGRALGTPSSGSPTATRPRAAPLERPTQMGAGHQSVEYTLEKAISLERRGDVDGAVYILKKAIAQSNNAAPLYNKLALALVKRREFSEAVQLLEKAVSLAPDDTSYQQNLYKVMGLAASSGKGKKDDKAGVLSGLFKRK